MENSTLFGFSTLSDNRSSDYVFYEYLTLCKQFKSFFSSNYYKQTKYQKQVNKSHYFSMKW